MAYSEQQWKEAKTRCRLNADDIRKAKEMGINPKSLIKNIPNKNQQWKLPVNQWIRDMWDDHQEKAHKKQLRKQAAMAEATKEGTVDANN